LLNKRRPPIGEKLKRIRELKRLTLKDLSARVGVSESLISQIENGKVSPSIDTLLALAEYLEVDPDYLFRDFKRRGKATVLHREERSRLRKGGVTYEQLSLLTEDGGRHAVEAVLLEIAPGKEKGSPDFGHEGRELGIILEGEGELSYGTEKYLLRSGDSVSFASDIPHVLHNGGGAPLKAIWIITPPKMHYFGGG
jgi:transcriptional regulator with XRE-family HTH domain